MRPRIGLSGRADSVLFGDQTAAEIENSFYRLPRPQVLAAWLTQTPPGFSLSFKAPARITHKKRLKGAGADLERFLAAIEAAKPKLGVLNFQLPPDFAFDLQRLKAFVLLLPRGLRCAFEFRHPSWFRPEVFDVLERRGMALTLNDADVEGAPLVRLCDFGFLKLRRLKYTDAELAAWLSRIEAQRWKETFVFFKHEERATGPALAARLQKLI